jgi:hypothetical protein
MGRARRRPAPDSIPPPPPPDPEGEAWRPVPGYEGIYRVSNRGRVQRIAPASTDGHSPGWAKVGRILKPQPGFGGYLTIRLYADGAFKIRTIHGLVAEAFLGPCPAGKLVAHKDENRLDNRPDNLEFRTKSEILQDTWDRRRRTKVFALGPEEMARAVAMKRAGQGNRKIAVALGVSHVTVIKAFRRADHAG